MKRISISKFQSNIYDYIPDEVPFVLTKRRKGLVGIVSFDKLEEYMVDKTVESKGQLEKKIEEAYQNGWDEGYHEALAEGGNANSQQKNYKEIVESYIEYEGNSRYIVGEDLDKLIKELEK